MLYKLGKDNTIAETIKNIQGIYKIDSLNNRICWRWFKVKKMMSSN